MADTERNINLQEMFFNVNLQDIFTDINGHNVKIKGKKALINTADNIPISIVSDGYEIITNELAYEYGLKCLTILFKLNAHDKIEVFNITRPSTLSFCHIDIISPDRKFHFKNDEYIPFVRITNSYNKMFKLHFRVGVCRWICENGMIIGDNSIRFSYNHMKGASEKVNFEIKADALEEILERFRNDVEILSNKQFNYEFLYPMIYKGLGMKPRKEPMSEKQRENAEEIDSAIVNLNKRYREEIGGSFYSVYNILTDICTRGIENESFAATRTHQRQLRAGKWLAEISTLLHKGSFDYKEYLKDYIESVKN